MAVTVVFDVENLCNDCDETKLGLLVQSTVSEYSAAITRSDADAQLNELLEGTAKNGPPAIPTPASDPVMVPPLVPGDAAAAVSRTAAPVGTDSTAKQPSTAAPCRSPRRPARKCSFATTPVASPQAPSQTFPPHCRRMEYASAGWFVCAAAAPVDSPNCPESTAAVPTQAPLWTQTPQGMPSNSAGSIDQTEGAGCGVWHARLCGALGGTIAAHYFDKRLDSTLAQNPADYRVRRKANAGQNCVLTTVGLWAPGYAVSGLLIGA